TKPGLGHTTAVVRREIFCRKGCLAGKRRRDVLEKLARLYHAEAAYSMPSHPTGIRGAESHGAAMKWLNLYQEDAKKWQAPFAFSALFSPRWQFAHHYAPASARRSPPGEARALQLPWFSSAICPTSAVAGVATGEGDSQVWHLQLATLPAQTGNLSNWGMWAFPAPAKLRANKPAWRQPGGCRPWFANRKNNA